MIEHLTALRCRSVSWHATQLWANYWYLHQFVSICVRLKGDLRGLSGTDSLMRSRDSPAQDCWLPPAPRPPAPSDPGWLCRPPRPPRAWSQGGRSAGPPAPGYSRWSWCETPASWTTFTPTHTEGERCLLVAPALRISPFCVSLSSPPVTDTDRRTNPELSIQPLGASCVSPPGALVSPDDLLGEGWTRSVVPPPGATLIVTEGITALRPITAKEYSCRAGWCRCALTLAPARARARTRTHAPQVRALPKLRHACQRS